MSEQRLAERVRLLIRDWNVDVQNTLETQSSVVVFGARGNQPVVVKVLRQPGDEWKSGEVLDAFGGKGIVRVYEYVEGAVLLERLMPGTSLAAVALSGRDEEATNILAEVIHQMSRPVESLTAFAAAEDWGKAFELYLTSGDNQIPIDLVERGQRLYAGLCASQRNRRLLHGDLQHYNVLFDSDRGWLAIDPKGVVGEVEYEIGASLRNPWEDPDMFASPKTIERRLLVYEARLKLDADRALAWGFAQAVLSAIWSVEDGFTVDANDPPMRLARAINAILK